MGWAVLHHASVSYDPQPPRHPPTRPNTHSTVPTTPLVQDTKCTRKRKAQPQPYTWHIFYFYVGLMSKYMKHEFASPSLRNKQWVCVNAAAPALQCFLEKEILFLWFYILSFNLQHHQEERHFLWTFISLHCYLPLQTESNQNQGYWPITRNGTHLHFHLKRETLTFLELIWLFFFTRQLSLCRYRSLFLSFHKNTCLYC